MHKCIYIDRSLYLFVKLLIYLFVHTYLFISTCMYLSTFLLMCLSIYHFCLYIYKYAYMYVCIHTLQHTSTLTLTHKHTSTLIHTHTHTQKQTRMQRFQHNMHSCKHYATIQGRSNDERRSTWSSQSAEFPWKRTRATVQLRENTTFSHNTLSECLGWTSDRHDLVPALYIQIKRGTLLIRKSMFYQRLPYPG